MISMDKRDIIAFFDSYAPQWDADQVPKDAIIRQILDNAHIGEGQHILDVACGTGILFPFYLERKTASVTGVDISPEMAKRAAQKFAGEPAVRVICGDVEQVRLDRQFDAVVVYNAFPHFPEPAKLIATLAALTRPGGRLTVAHGASREQIDAHHHGAASKVSVGLMEARALQQLFAPYFDVDVVISDEKMYQVCGIRK